jgi:hypothetical protein
MPMGDQICLPVRFFLYGAAAPSAAEREEPTWKAFLSGRFPPA